MRTLGLAVLLVLAGVPAWAGDWPQMACTPQRTEGLGCINNTLACVSGTVIVPSLDGIHGLDTQTGRRKWPVDGPGGFTTAPLVAEEKVFIGSRLGTIYCLNPADGKASWTADTGSYICLAPLARSPRWWCTFYVERTVRQLLASIHVSHWRSGRFQHHCDDIPDSCLRLQGHRTGMRTRAPE